MNISCDAVDREGSLVDTSSSLTAVSRHRVSSIDALPANVILALHEPRKWPQDVVDLRSTVQACSSQSSTLFGAQYYNASKFNVTLEHVSRNALTFSA